MKKAMYILEHPIFSIFLTIVTLIASVFIGDILVTTFKYRGVVKAPEKNTGLAVSKRLLFGLSFIGIIALILHEIFS